jgi:hypothetical protein
MLRLREPVRFVEYHYIQGDVLNDFPRGAEVAWPLIPQQEEVLGRRFALGDRVTAVILDRDDDMTMVHGARRHVWYDEAGRVAHVVDAFLLRAIERGRVARNLIDEGRRK